MNSTVFVNSVRWPDRRLNRRFKVINGGFVIFRSEPFIVGDIHDISRGGLSFYYIQRDNIHIEASEMDILLNRGSFLLEINKFKSILDVAVLEHTNGLSSLKMRRRNIQFGKLSKNQLSELGYLFDNYASNNLRKEEKDLLHPI